MILGLAVILFVLWLLGLLGHIAGGFIHIVLLLAIIAVVMHFVTSRA